MIMAQQQQQSPMTAEDGDEAADEVNAAKPICWEQVRLTPRLAQTLDHMRTEAIEERLSGFEGFGSFHSEDVETLIAKSAEDYKAPSFLPTFAQRILTRSELQARGGYVAPITQHGGAGAVSANRVGGAASAGGGTDGVDYSPTSRKRPRESPSPLCAGGDDDKKSVWVQDDLDGIVRVHASREESGSMTDPELGAAVVTQPVQRHTPIGDRSVVLAQLTATPSRCVMGAVFREEHYSIDPNVVFINQGAFGSALVGTLAIKHSYEHLMEAEVVEFVDRKLLPLVVHSIRALADFVNADPRQLVLVQNATYALNCAMQLIEADDVVAFLDTEYLAVYKMMWFRCQEVGARMREVALSKYLHDEAIMGDDAALTQEVLRQLPEGCTTFVVDLITSTAALHLPLFTHLIPALRHRGVQKIIVDGAHGPLQLALDFRALAAASQPTIFVGNLHKWFSAPKSVGFLWVRKEDQESVHTVVVSHGAGNGLLSEFIWDGTRDYSAYLCVPALVAFWRAQGPDRVRRYCSQLLESAVTMLTQAFRSRRVARHAPFMALVELPEELQDDFITVKYIQDVLHKYYHIEVPVKRVEERHYVRLSAFVYNTPEDYVYLREAILSIGDKWFHSDERRQMAIARHHVPLPTAATELPSDVAPPAEQQQQVPCDERIRRQGGCGVSGLDASLKRRKTRKFA